MKFKVVFIVLIYTTRTIEKLTLEAVPSINYIGRQLDVSYISRQVYGEIIYLSDKNSA